MREALVILSLLLIVSLYGCPEEKPDRYKAGIYESCKLNWKDSGYEFRLSDPYKAFANSDVLGYLCQVKVNDRWVNEDNVKIGN